MTPEWKEKWLAALRSGEYNQGQNRLKHGNDFCCLGVLCDIASKEANLGEWNHRDQFVTKDGEIRTGSLPIIVYQYVGLLYEDVLVTTEENDKIHVSTLNDANASFAQIADYIERTI